MLQELVAGPMGPLVVYFLRVTDVSMATIRMLLIMRNRRFLAPLIGFFEILAIRGNRVTINQPRITSLRKPFFFSRSL